MTRIENRVQLTRSGDYGCWVPLTDSNSKWYMSSSQNEQKVSDVTTCGLEIIFSAASSNNTQTSAGNALPS